jgi:predicted NUDIX family NTP pyrophosphohydrolase
MQWPPRSGREVSFPEIDRAEFFDLAEGQKRINIGQLPLLEELQALVGAER